jgi:hypothetical protein
MPARSHGYADRVCGNGSEGEVADDEERDQSADGDRDVDEQLGMTRVAGSMGVGTAGGERRARGT